jgi:hypothetical protein
VTEPTAYDRGVIAGEVAARLAGHDEHFAAINGALTRVAEELHGLRLAVQRLGDQAAARDATAATTAAALKDADDARRDAAERRWSPVAKVFAVLGALAAVAAVAGLLILLWGP